jgi:hypothetical protein
MTHAETENAARLGWEQRGCAAAGTLTMIPGSTPPENRKPSTMRDTAARMAKKISNQGGCGYQAEVITPLQSLDNAFQRHGHAVYLGRIGLCNRRTRRGGAATTDSSRTEATPVIPGKFAGAAGDNDDVSMSIWLWQNGSDPIVNPNQHSTGQYQQPDNYDVCQRHHHRRAAYILGALGKLMMLQRHTVHGRFHS